MSTLFVNARLLDPATGLDALGTLLVEHGRIAALNPPSAPASAERIDCAGACLCPGLVDMRVGLREPGEEHKESLATLAACAAAGGITTLAALPDTDPPLDEPALVEFVTRRAGSLGVTVIPYGAATKGCAGRELAELGLLREAGAAAFTDGRRAIAEARTMRLALAYAAAFGAFIIQHPEEPSLAAGGAVTEGFQATMLGLPGIPAAAEAIMVARDIRLAALTGGHVHFAHVSTAEALGLIRAAKAQGVRVTCDTAPPYFDLNETAIGEWRSYARLSPPLRTEADRVAVLAALADGTIDAVASDHQPQDTDAKRLPFAQAEPGGVGLETLLAVTLNAVHAGHLPLLDALGLLTHRPAALLGVEAGRLAEGLPADLCLFDLDRAWQIRADDLSGNSRNTPFDGRPVQGKVVGTWKAGRRVFG